MDQTPTLTLPPHRLCVAPMMDWTDRHCRYFLRQISRHAWLYTEMITASAIRHGDRDRLLGFSPEEHPLALQVGGAVPDDMAHAAERAAAYGYDEVNINAGCPSDRVQAGRFGACLMAEPGTVAACVRAMRRAGPLPVTVKCRIGIDHRDSYDDLAAFVGAVADAGCSTVIVHARKAWLSGLSPKENRSIPPLLPDLVYRVKRDFRSLEIVINGGILNLDQALAHLDRVDGVMIGRAAYQDPFVLAEADRRLFDGAAPVRSRAEIVEAMLPYIGAELAAGTRFPALIRPMIGLFQGVPGGRAWRRHLTGEAVRRGAGPEIVEEALDLTRPAERKGYDEMVCRTRTFG